VEDKSYHQAKQELLEVFVPSSPQWRKIAIGKGMDLCLRGINALTAI
jgi:hypothetical protein